MAAEPQLYTLIHCFAESTLLSEEASVSMARDAGSSPSKTVAKGYAGETPGAPMTELDVENMVPMAGMEFDAGRYMATMTPLEMMLASHGKQYIFKGFVISDAIKHSVNGDTGYSFKVRGAMSEWGS